MIDEHTDRLGAPLVRGWAACAKGWAALVLWCVLGASADAGTALEFDFASSDHGFVAGFADYPTNASAGLYQLTNNWVGRPSAPAGAPALFISGNNHSDDLWMYWKKHVIGLKPNTEYALTMEIEFASKYATGLVGIGGAPGDGVYLKTGASALEPLAVVSDEAWFRMNIDKGNQAVGGLDMPLRGTIAKPDDGNSLYVLISRHHHGLPQTVTTAADGSLWLVFGTDSGFEGTTSLYYTRLTVWLNPRDEPCVWCYGQDDGLRLVWNEGALQTTTNLMDAMGWMSVWPDHRPYIALFGTDPVRFWKVQK